MLQTAFFKVDVTPPVGAQMAYDLNRQVDTPIFIRGLVIDDGCSRVVLVSCDFIGIYGQTWFDWRRVVAAAAGTVEDLVFLHSIHQHDSMRIAPWINPMLERHGEIAVEDRYCRQVLGRLEQAVAAAVAGHWRRIVKLMTSERRLSGLASNRRMIDQHGKCFASRYSQCADSALQARPVGVIDPLLRTVAWLGEQGEMIAAMHFYASHPMAAYRREMVGQDVPGVALGYVAEQLGEDVFNIYFTGCAGNVTFGKYHLGDKEKSMVVLGRRLGRGLLANLQRLEEKPLAALSCRKVDFEFPLNPGITVDKMAGVLAREGASRTDLLRAARNLAILDNWSEWRRCSVYRLSLGPEVDLLSLPGEVCVEYQLYAQSLVPEKLLACAACGNATYAYIPTARMYEEGGYEPNSSIGTPAVEQRLKQAITELLD